MFEREGPVSGAPIGDGLNVGAAFWGAFLVVVTAMAAIAISLALLSHWTDEGLSEELERVSTVWLTPVAVLGLIWMVFQNKRSEVWLWAAKLRRERSASAWNDAANRYVAAGKPWSEMEAGAWAWGISLIVITLALGSLFVLKGSAAPGIGKAFGPIVLGVGLIWQVFLSSAVDAQMSEFEEYF